jgi:ubiquinone/menaquinone biosynthesis C-methylase UbiE
MQARTRTPTKGIERHPVQIPDYVLANYWWAYIHPKGVRLFERQWLVNLILWGNYARLRDAAVGECRPGMRTLQIACVYGDFSKRLAERLAHSGCLDIVDVLPIQLANLRSKLKTAMTVSLHQCDATALEFADASYDQVILFFLLHEQPAPLRAQTLAEAVRVVKPGGKVVVVDYHRPTPLQPLRYIFRPILHALEPYALDLWEHDIVEWLPDAARGCANRKQTYFGGLYQKLVITVSAKIRKQTPAPPTQRVGEPLDCQPRS